MSREATLTLRVIRSFEHRNIRPIILKNISLDLTVQELLDTALKSVHAQSSLPPPVRNYDYNTFKITHRAHGWKTNDPVINVENDEELLLLDWRKRLRDYGIGHETELSFFNMDDYKRYKDNPHHVI